MLESTQHRNQRSRMRKRHHRKNYRIGVCCLIVMVFIAAVLLIGNIAIVPQFYGNSMAGQTNGQNLSGSNSTSQSDFIDLENLYSPYAILIDASSGEVISVFLTS